MWWKHFTSAQRKAYWEEKKVEADGRAVAAEDLFGLREDSDDDTCVPTSGDELSVDGESSPSSDDEATSVASSSSPVMWSAADCASAMGAWSDYWDALAEQTRPGDRATIAAFPSSRNNRAHNLECAMPVVPLSGAEFRH